MFKAGRSKEVDIDEPEADSHEPMRIEEAQDFFLPGDGRLRQRSEKSKDLGPAGESAAVERKLEVKVKKEGVDVISLKQYIAKAPPAIIIVDFQSGAKKIKFSLKNYARVSTEGKVHGAADVRIVIFDDTSTQVFSDRKTLDLIKDETNISLSFNQLKSGTHFIIIDAFDRITGAKDVYSAAIEL